MSTESEVKSMFRGYINHYILVTCLQLPKKSDFTIGSEYVIVSWNRVDCPAPSMATLQTYTPANVRRSRLRIGMMKNPFWKVIKNLINKSLGTALLTQPLTDNDIAAEIASNINHNATDFDEDFISLGLRIN